MIKDRNGRQFPHDPAMKGYNVIYRAEGVNFCPGCGRSHWVIGRMTAECAFCATALPLDNPSAYGSSIVRTITGADRARALAA
jgi:hypothetical protein